MQRRTVRRLLYVTLFSSILFYYIMLHCNILYRTLLYSILSYSILLYYVIPYYIILYYTILYYFKLCYTIFFYSIIIRCCSLLYSTIHFLILYHAVPKSSWPKLLEATASPAEAMLLLLWLGLLITVLVPGPAGISIQQSQDSISTLSSLKGHLSSRNPTIPIWYMDLEAC